MATPAFVNAGTYTSGNSPPLPGSRVNGNILIAVGVSRGNGLIYCQTDGWFRWKQYGSFVGGSGVVTGIFTRLVDGTETAPTLTGANSSRIYQFSGNQPVNPPIGAYSLNSGTGNPHTGTSITTLVDEALCLYIDGNRSVTLPTPATWTELTEDTNGSTGIVVGDKAVTPAGSGSGSISVNSSSAAQDWGMALAELQPGVAIGTMFVDAGNQINTSSATTITPVMPGGRVNGDLLVAVCARTNSLGGTGALTCATAGWSKYTAQISGVGVAAVNAAIFTRIVDGTETDPTIDLASSTLEALAQVMLYRGNDITNPPFGAMNVNTGTGTPRTCTGVTALFDNSCAIYITASVNDTLNQWIDRPQGWNQDTQSLVYNVAIPNSSETLITGSKNLGTAGTNSGTISVTGPSGSNWILWQIEVLAEPPLEIVHGTLSLTGKDVTLTTSGSTTITLDIASALSLSSGGDLTMDISVPVDDAALTLTASTSIIAGRGVIVDAATLTLTPEPIGIVAPLVLSIQPAMLTLTGEDVINLSCGCYDTSQSYEFGQHTQIIDIITEAFERCGIDGTLISGTMLDSARRSLEYMFSEWANNGPNLFSVYQYTITLIPGQQSYTLPSNTIYVVNAATRQIVNQQVTDLTISGISRAEYLALPNKNQTAQRPTQFYLERTTIPVIYPWPVLQANTSCEIVTYLLRIQQDITKFCGAVDGPQRAMDAIAAGLAKRLSLKYAKPEFDRLKIESQEAYDLFLREDRERVPYRIVPDASGWSPV